MPVFPCFSWGARCVEAGQHPGQVRHENDQDGDDVRGPELPPAEGEVVRPAEGLHRSGEEPIPGKD